MWKPNFIIQFDTGFKGISRGEARGACIERLKHMNIEIGSDYSNPIGLNMVTKTWASFVKIHLRAQHKDGFALLMGEHTFVLEMEDSEKVM